MGKVNYTMIIEVIPDSFVVYLSQTLGCNIEDLLEQS